MELADRNLVITGAGSGIGRALALRMARERPRCIVVADLNEAGAAAVAAEIGSIARPVSVDVSREAEIAKLVAQARRARRADRPVLLECGRSGTRWWARGAPTKSGSGRGRSTRWPTSGRHALVLPEMVQRGEGYLLSTASAAGLLTQVGALAYSVTKHAAVAVAEWLAITYGDAGVRVSCLCPQGVRTPMLDLAIEDPIGAAPLLAEGLLEPEEVADVVIEGIRDERFLILPHPQVADYMALKATQNERWLKGMRRMVRQAREARGG